MSVVRLAWRGAVIALVACRGAAHRPAAARSYMDARMREVPLALPTSVARGIAYAHDWSAQGQRGYGTESDRAQLDRLRSLGATWVCVMPFGYMSSAQSLHVHTAYDRPGGETDAALTRTVREAHARGLRVLLKPHLWVHGSWPGALEHEGPEALALLDEWSMLTLHYADLASREHVEAFTVGVEMDPLAQRAPERWRTLIAEVRMRYGGVLTYAANWSNVATIPLWPWLDVVAVNHYAPLADTPGRAERDLVERRAAEALARYAEIAARHHKPVWLTEVGFRRDARALVAPWAWVASSPTPREPALQAMGYEATFRAVARTPSINAVFLWKWFTSGGDEDEGADGFVFTNREAEAVVRSAFAPRPTPQPLQ